MSYLSPTRSELIPKPQGSFVAGMTKGVFELQDPTLIHLASQLALVEWSANGEQLIEESGQKPVKQLAPWQHAAATNFILKSLYRRIGTDEIAEKAGLSSNYFSRAFKATFGCSPQEHVRRCRLYKARLLLLGTSKALVDISAECGFADQAHFSRVFRRDTGYTPHKWRQLYKPLPRM